VTPGGPENLGQGSVESFSKRGSPRSDFHVGSIRSHAGVTKYRSRIASPSSSIALPRSPATNAVRAET